MDDPELVRPLLGVGAERTPTEVRERRLEEGANLGTCSKLFVDILLDMNSMFLSRRPIMMLAVKAWPSVSNVYSLTAGFDNALNKRLVWVLSEAAAECLGVERQGLECREK